MQPQVEQTAEDQRTCPVCHSINTGAGYNGRVRRGGESVDLGSCSCQDCGARWQEDYYRRSQRTVNHDIKPGQVKTHQPALIQLDEAARPFEQRPDRWYLEGERSAVDHRTARERDLLAALRRAAAGLALVGVFRHARRF